MSNDNKKHYEEFIKGSPFNAPVEDLFQWHLRPGALERLSPPWDPIKVISKQGSIDKGGKVVLKMKAGPFFINWVAVHYDYIANRLFRDRQLKGPFSEWIHSHIFSSDGKGRCFLEDRVGYRFYFHGFTKIFLKTFTEKKLAKIFRYRHDILSGDMKIHKSAPAGKKMRIAVTGSGGLIGSALVPFLETGGHTVINIVRNKTGNTNEIYWDPYSGSLDPGLFRDIDAVIHLSGEPIGNGSWTGKKKKKIMDSRSMSTGLIAECLSKIKKWPGVFISSSAIGYYGNRGDDLLTEKEKAGGDFISNVCIEWEKAAGPLVNNGIRAVFIRFGVVLTPAGGALKRLLLPFGLGLGGRIGSGKQYMSWVGMDDALGAIHFALFNKKIHGPVNVTAPEPVTNSEFTEILAKVINRPAMANIPAWLIRLIFGQMGREVLLSSARVKPEKLLNEGYNFRHGTLPDALKHVLGRP